MAFPALGVQRSLQPWRIAGLRHWLFESEEDRAMALRGVRRSTEQAAPVRPVQAASAEAAAPPPAPRAEAPRSHPPRPESPRSETPRAEGVRAAPDLETPPEVMPVNAWPEDWKTLLAKSPSSPKVVWTYAAMSDDYGGRSNPVRRAFLQRLLKDLAMPAGSNAFWPMSAPPFDTPCKDVDPLFFHSGLAALNPKVVAFLGDVPEALRLPRLLPMVPGLFQGRRLVRVQSVETLSGFLTAEDVETRTAALQRHDSLVQFLKSVFMMVF